MSRAKIIIKYKGASWRVGSSWRCASNRDCDLFERGVCDSDGRVEKLPCDEIRQAFIDATCSCQDRGFKKIKEVNCLAKNYNAVREAQAIMKEGVK